MGTCPDGRPSPFGPFPQLLTVPEVAEILKLSPRTVRRMIDDRRLSVVRLGRAVRIRPEILAALIEGK
jgi:excisionase family DNA binding protein